MAGVNSPYRYQYETVAAGQTAQTLGGTGAVGDYIDQLVVTVNTAATSTVTLLDNATSIPLMPATVAVGVYVIPLKLCSASGAWKITTGAGVTVVASGIFSA